MKINKKTVLIVLLIVLIFSTAACVKKVKPIPGGNGNGTSLTPANITFLADLTNYSLKESYYSPSAVSYSDTSQEITKLQNRITEKRNDENYDTLSSVVKIFANSEPDKIINAMAQAALPNAKMTAVVDYLAGETSTSENDIVGKVESGIWSPTPGWSFFDDYDYYEKLQDKADETNATDKDKDNVKRQYRNIAGKVFAIGMKGDEFARMLVKEILYAITVVEEMSGAAFNMSPTDTKTDPFWNYCKTELDYDTLVYFLAFKEYYNASNGLANSVQLYGYYYDYEKKIYDETNDDEFEKGLKYSHMKTFTNAEWLEYVGIQRSAYTDSYRYSDNFYEKFFYAAHLAFQEVKENKENTVYGIRPHNNTFYTVEMRAGMSNGGFAGQMKMSDWLWCYGGDESKMIAYNSANTLYENGKNQGAENSAEGEFAYDKEQLKITSYLLGNMTNIELGCALRYQVYNYSSDMIGSIQKNKKEITLLSAGAEEPEEYITVNGYAKTQEEAKEYAQGKLEAFINQMATALSNAGVSSKASSAATESWSTMKSEVDNALDDKNYASIATYVDKLQRLEDLVIKRIWSCGAEIDDYSKCEHAECSKKYDTTHAISKFADKYASILQHVSGQAVVDFQYIPKDTNYNMLNADKTDIWYAPKYFAIASNNKEQTNYEQLTREMVIDGNDYVEYQKITVEKGLGLVDGIFDGKVDKRGQDKMTGENWWNNVSKPAKDKANSVPEKPPGSGQTQYFNYEYIFTGWYLDANLLYKMEDNDKVNCELTLYAGYRIRKALSAP